MSTFFAKKEEQKPRWHVIDADGKVLGKVAVTAARLLRGKDKAIFTPHVDTGDFVVVVNAEKVRVTGRKEDQKLYFRHSGYPGGFRTTAFRDMQRQHPERVIEKAVRGMVPHTNLGRQQLGKLHVYAGPSHPHAAQQPTELNLGEPADS